MAIDIELHSGGSVLIFVWCVADVISLEVQALNMFALKSVRDILEFMSLLSNRDESLGYVKNVLITIPMVLLLAPLCAYLTFHGNNLLNATDVFYVIAATILCIAQYWILVMQKRPVRELLTKLQTLIDQSIWSRKRPFRY